MHERVRHGGTEGYEARRGHGSGIAAVHDPRSCHSAEGTGGCRAVRATRGQLGASFAVDSVKLAEAVAFAISRESKTPRDLELNHLQSFGREPLGDAIGPLPPRGAATGVIVRKGYVVATWGDPGAEEITNSVTKSFLSTVVGLAVDDGRIRSVRDTVAEYVPPIVRARPNGTAYARDWPGTDRLLTPFDTPHNRTITWDDLLRQVSDWEGTLWGKPEWADRPAADASTWTTRPR